MSNIEWTEKTWNPVIGCNKVSAGCANCYAETMAYRLACMADAESERNPDKYGRVGRIGEYRHVVKYTQNDPDGHPLPQWNETVRCISEALSDPLRWRKPRMIFVNSMSDLFHANVPSEYIIKVLAVAALCPQHTMQILTKRAERMYEIATAGDLGHKIYKQVTEWLDEGEGGFLGQQWDRCHELASQSTTGVRFEFTSWKLPLKNVLFGASTEDQPTYDQRHPYIDKITTAGWTTFLSIEPLLSEIVLKEESLYCEYCGSSFESYDAGNGLGGTETYCSECSANDPDSMSTIMGCGLGVSWVIVGGESGPKARPCNTEHIRAIIEQCKISNTPVFVKQLGSRPFETCELCGGIGYYPQESDEVCKVCDGNEVTRLRLKSSKGSDMSEWPENLRVRQFPQTGGA